MKINISKTSRTSSLSTYARVLMTVQASASRLLLKSDKDSTPSKTTNRTKKRESIRVQIIQITCSAKSYHNSLTKMERARVTRVTAYQLYRWFRIVDSRATHRPLASLLLVSKAIVMRRRNRMVYRLRTTYVIDLLQRWWTTRRIHVRTIHSRSQRLKKT